MTAPPNSLEIIEENRDSYGTGKTFFELPGYYEGLRARKIRQQGRLWLVKIINDPPPYWFVIIKNFDRKLDAKTGAKRIGAWRIQWEDEAIAKFESLRQFFPAYAKRVPSPAQLASRKAFKELAASRKTIAPSPPA